MEFNAMMRQLCRETLLKEYQAAKEAPISALSVALDADAVSRLAKKISLLPVDYQNILFYRYCFHFSVSETEEMLLLENVKGQLRYIQNMLTYFMDVQDAKIEDIYWCEAAQIALERSTNLEEDSPLIAPQYSARFRWRLRKIKAAQQFSDFVLLVARRVAVFFLVCTIGFSTVLVANADVREHFFAWLIETFPQFSIFSAQPQEEVTITAEDFEQVEVQYVPKGFVLEERILRNTRAVYEFNNGQGEKITINITGSSKKYLDTEDAIVQQMEFKGATAFFWTKSNTSYFIWQQDGLSCNIVATCSMKETIKIAENIKS